MGLPGPRVLALAFFAPVLACVAGDGMRFEVINMERPPDGLGLAPPPDYGPFYWGEARGYDRTGDGRIDEVRVMLKGRERCYGEDTDHDGVIDTWELVDERGEIVRRARHVQGDGRLNDGATFEHIPLEGVHSLGALAAVHAEATTTPLTRTVRARRRWRGVHERSSTPAKGDSTHA
jgi:hypothetical protein